MPKEDIIDRTQLGFLLNRMNLTGVGVEVGVFRGDYAVELLRSWKGSLLILVDPWEHLPDYLDSWNLQAAEMEQNYQFTLDRLAPYSDRIRILRTTSQQAAPLVKDHSCDFVYIDANHAYEAVRADLRLWYPKLRSGALMAGHDYFDARADELYEPIFKLTNSLRKEELTSYGVKSAVDEFAAHCNVTLSITDETHPTWWFEKP
jgi:hypothetical protein